MLALVLCSALLSAPDTAERPSQAYAQVLIAEMHIARNEWKQAEDALRYALVFDYENTHLRNRLGAVLERQGKLPAAHHSRFAKNLRSFKRAIGRARADRIEARLDRASDASVAERKKR